MVHLQEQLRKLPVEQLNRSEILFQEFLQEVYSQTPSDIFPLVENIIGGFEHWCSHDGDGNFARVRGGAMRNFLFKTSHLDRERHDFIKQLPNSYKARDEFTKRVIDYTFPGITDLDVRFSFNRPLTKDELHEIIVQNLPENQEYIVTFDTFQIGNVHRRPVERVHFTKRSNRQKV